MQCAAVLQAHLHGQPRPDLQILCGWHNTSQDIHGYALQLLRIHFIPGGRPVKVRLLLSSPRRLLSTVCLCKAINGKGSKVTLEAQAQ